MHEWIKSGVKRGEREHTVKKKCFTQVKVLIVSSSSSTSIPTHYISMHEWKIKRKLWLFSAETTFCPYKWYVGALFCSFGKWRAFFSI